MATTRSAARSLRNQINSQRATSSLSTRAIPSCAPSPRQAFAPSSSRYLSSSSCYSAQPAAARRAPSSSTVQHGRHTTTLNRPQSMHGSSTRNMLLALSLAGSAIFWLSCTDATSPIRNDARSPAPNDTTSSISTLHGGHEFLGIHLWGSNRCVGGHRALNWGEGGGATSVCRCLWLSPRFFRMSRILLLHPSSFCDSLDDRSPRMRTPHAGKTPPSPITTTTTHPLLSSDTRSCPQNQPMLVSSR